jgi:hypothetical protein
VSTGAITIGESSDCIDVSEALSSLQAEAVDDAVFRGGGQNLRVGSMSLGVDTGMSGNCFRPLGDSAGEEVGDGVEEVVAMRRQGLRSRGTKEVSLQKAGEGVK